MSTVRTRTFLAKALEDALPKRKYVIFPDSLNRDAIGKPTLVLVRDAIQPMPEAPGSFRANTFGLFVVSDRVADADYLDDLVDEVLDALTSIPNALFSQAERRPFSDTNPAYEITVTFPDDRQKEA
jgi:hypothetical protein